MLVHAHISSLLLSNSAQETGNGSVSREGNHRSSFVRQNSQPCSAFPLKPVGSVYACVIQCLLEPSQSYLRTVVNLYEFNEQLILCFRLFLWAPPILFFPSQVLIHDA